MTDTLDDNGSGRPHLSLKVLRHLLEMAIAEGQARADRPCLFFLSGSRTDEAQELPRDGTVRLGRHPDCEVLFDAYGDLKVSTTHAEIVCTDGAAVICDLDSKNGTFVNETRIEKATPLASGDLIQLAMAGPQIAVVLPAEEPDQTEETNT